MAKFEKISFDEFRKNVDSMMQFCMREYGWTIEEVKRQPYETLCRMIIEKGEEKESQKQQEVITGSALKQLFGS